MSSPIENPHAPFPRVAKKFLDVNGLYYLALTLSLALTFGFLAAYGATQDRVANRILLYLCLANLGVLIIVAITEIFRHRNRPHPNLSALIYSWCANVSVISLMVLFAYLFWFG